MFVHKKFFFLIYFVFFAMDFFSTARKAQTFIVMHLLKLARHSLNDWKSIRNEPLEKSIAVFLVIDQMLSTDLINYSNYICSTGNRQRSHTYGCCQIWKMLPKKMATNSVINIHICIMRRAKIRNSFCRQTKWWMPNKPNKWLDYRTTSFLNRAMHCNGMDPWNSFGKWKCTKQWC